MPAAMSNKLLRTVEEQQREEAAERKAAGGVEDMLDL
jgi:hypothetical protein